MMWWLWCCGCVTSNGSFYAASCLVYAKLCVNVYKYISMEWIQAICLSFESFILTRMPCHKMFHVEMCASASACVRVALSECSIRKWQALHCIECICLGIFMSQSANMNIVSFYSLFCTTYSYICIDVYILRTEHFWGTLAQSSASHRE